MGHKNITLVVVKLAGGKRAFKGTRVVGLDFLFGKEGAHLRRLQEGQKPKIHRPEFVFEFHPMHLAVEKGREVHPLFFQDALRIGHALRRIMVSWNSKNHDVALHEFADKPIERLHRFGAGRRLVVQVARYNHGIELALAGNAHDSLKSEALIVEHVEAVDDFADM